MTLHPAAAQSPLAAHPTRLGKPLLYSAGAHVAVVLLALGYSALFGGPRIDLDQKPIQARLVRKGTPRDPKLLPRKEAPPAPPQKVEGAPEPVPVAVPAPQKPAVAIAGVEKSAPRPQAQAGAASGDTRKKLFGAFDKVAAQRDEELAGAEDGHELGDSDVAEGEQYYALLIAQVRRQYDLPQTISDAERMRLRAHVLLMIGRAGEVTRVQITKSSGNAMYDSAVLSAVKRSSPFSPPPEHLRSALQRSGVVLEFTP